ncbi:EamA family transporter RarD [Staphylococcus pseudoxylosus]|uniref:EamA family transporter RarD n=1 Tax=Staphylococcus pseudoxylosus TaxID=2282419 RepID=UPI000D1D99FA|nr:EamA family transporter RarD [Staphylococcus pseudoxylosus]PTI57328.1 EamA family transporter RarD [Staphylococcus xylosus]MDW8798813.1 EamA family transporter RarD [Staphylococcus pseudoxylosus]MEB6035815.1 EamA family transporter RarD [Staphylococcus pseudoxylosus]MEB6045108.1 EamA family transporter RarD [Staphylococcus pseudoxylosus]MEB7763111.1 EamA family transporter RarD [Staphylococcus pseudoxylosus]
MNTEFKKGIIFAFGAYFLWGILPIYWGLIDDIGAFEILAFRIVLSMIFMLFIVILTKNTAPFKRDIQRLFTNPIQLIAIIAAGYVITINWGTFIWAVTNGHVLQSSLGYYINPLVSILLALIFLKERFNKLEWIAIGLAVVGVLYMTLKIGVFPGISLLLAGSFGIYGLIKKLVPIDAISSITIECIVTAPAGFIYLWYIWHQGGLTFGMNVSSFWLLFSGAVTAVPLILFSAGARRIPLSLTGFIQYIGPTLMFLIGIFLFKEPFDLDQLITFIFIWVGIIIYSISQYVKIKKDKNPVIN